MHYTHIKKNQTAQTYKTGSIINILKSPNLWQLLQVHSLNQRAILDNLSHILMHDSKKNKIKKIKNKKTLKRVKVSKETFLYIYIKQTKNCEQIHLHPLYYIKL